MSKTAKVAFLWGVVAVLAVSCAGPSLDLYTLRAGQPAAEGRALDRSSVIIAIARVAIPDELDNEDILVRSGVELHRSARGRWATRLSEEVTDRVTARLAGRWPDALVTSAPQRQTPTYRIVITLNRSDISSDGHATLSADWVIIPRDPAALTRRDRTVVVVDGPVATDMDVVRLQGIVLDKLSGIIGDTGL